MDLPLLLSAFSSLVAAFVGSAIWATRPTGVSSNALSLNKASRPSGKLPAERSAAS